MKYQVPLPTPFDWQREVLASPSRHKILCIGRQAGKTTYCEREAVLAILAGKKVLWASPSFHYSELPSKRIREKLNFLIKDSNKITHQFDFKTGGSLTIRSGDNPDSFRSLNFDLLIFDEFAFAKEECWAIVRPVLSVTRGRAILVSTPDGHNHFHDMFYDYQNYEDWKTWHLPSSVSPLMTQDELDKAKADIGEIRFRQEYMAEFISKELAIFDPTYFNNILIDQFPGPFIRGVIAVDASLGTSIKSDFSCIIFAGVMNDQTIYIDCNLARRDIQVMLNDVKSIYNHYKPNHIVFESNGFQAALIKPFNELFTPIPPPVFGLNNMEKKENRISRLAPYFARKQIKILNNSGGKTLIHQLQDYPVGQNDDGPDALEMAIRSLYQIELK